MPITQYDIAREVGVSQTIVSDVLQGRPRGRVSDQTRQRILEAARRMGYQVNAAARALRTGQSRSVLYMVVRSETGRNPELGDTVISGLAYALTSQNYKLIVLTESAHEGALQDLQQMLLASECDGCVLRVSEKETWDWSVIRDTKRPVLILGRGSNLCLPSLSYDALGSMRIALGRLADRGHRRIGFLGAHENIDNAEYAASLWHTVSREFGIDPIRWFDRASEREEANVIAGRWLAEEHGPTALICLHQRAAVGVTSTILRSGLQLGENFDLIVCGDMVAGGSISPWLYEPGTWYFENDPDQIGRLAAEQIIRLIEEKNSAGTCQILPKLRQVPASL